jgi:oligogalacturonide lyase
MQVARQARSRNMFHSFLAELARTSVLRFSLMLGQRWTRRGFLRSLAAGSALAAKTKGEVFPPERVRYADPSTEFPVVRLTSPDHTSLLPAPCQRGISRKRSFLIFSNDRTGSLQLMQMFLNTGEARRLTEAVELDPSSPALSPDDRGVFFFDGPMLRYLAFSGLREREVYRVPEGWKRTRGFSVSGDGSRAVLVEEKAGQWRLRSVPLGTKEGQVQTVFEVPAPLGDPLPRPRHQEILYRDRDGALILASGDGRVRQRLPLDPGRAGDPCWAADGESLLYLSPPAGPGRLSAIREWVEAAGKERLVAETSQYAAFAPNANGSVFVGASGSKASPYVLLLLRIARRELALCEHRASDPALTSPVFSPDSQRVFFQSDRHGKSAIYAVAVERLVERIEE